MKTMKATQCGNGWNVEITERISVHDMTDVKRIARQEGIRHDNTALNELFLNPLNQDE